tara:strand:+ start:870 stop:1814 length:945 start_codon:yes stop_codon:yes gene_type:complete
MAQLAFLFPGQGSQSVGMLDALIEQSDIVRHTFNQASEVLGYDLINLVLQGPEEILNQTDKTQPALLTASVALWRLYLSTDRPLPQFLAGHSLGEYSALVCAEALSFEDALRLVKLRGELMQEAVPQGSGSMYAVIGLADDAIHQACEAASLHGVVSPVNFNSPGQVVIAGVKEAVEHAAHLCKEQGAKRILPLSVSVPSHCALMQPAAEKLSSILERIEIKTPKIPVINNVDVVSYHDADEIKGALVRQLYSPVRWTETIQSLHAMGVEHMVECGPGKVLSGLTRRIQKSITSTAMVTMDLLEVTETKTEEKV